MNLNLMVFKWIIFAGIVGDMYLARACSQQIIQLSEIKDVSKEIVKQFLTDFWEPGPETRAAAEQAFATVPSPGQDVVLAFVANRLNDSQTKTALTALDEATSRDPKWIDGWLLKSYLNILARDYEAGLMSLRSAKRSMSPTLTEQQRHLVFERAGQLVGYLQGPAPKLVNPGVFDSTVEFILKEASDAEVQTFIAAAETISNQYTQLREATDESLDQELERQAILDADRHETLTRENQDLQQTSRTLNDQWNKLRQELSEREAQLSAQLTPLQSSASTMESQIYSLQLTLQNLYWDLSNAQNGPVVYPFTVQSILNQISRVELSLINLQSSYQATLAQYNHIRSQIRDAQAAYNRQANEIQKELKRISGTLKKNQNELTRLAGGPRIASGKKESRESRVAGLKSYIRLSPALIKQELLETME